MAQRVFCLIAYRIQASTGLTGSSSFFCWYLFLIQPHLFLSTYSFLKSLLGSPMSSHLAKCLRNGSICWSITPASFPQPVRPSPHTAPLTPALSSSSSSAGPPTGFQSQPILNLPTRPLCQNRETVLTSHHEDLMLAKAQGPLTSEKPSEGILAVGKRWVRQFQWPTPQRSSNPKHFCPLTVSELAVELSEAKWGDWEMGWSLIE